MRDVMVKLIRDRMSDFFQKRFNKQYVKAKVIYSDDNMEKIEIKCVDELIFSVLSDKIKDIVDDLQSIMQKMYQYGLVEYVPVIATTDGDENIIYVTIGYNAMGG